MKWDLSWLHVFALAAFTTLLGIPTLVLAEPFFDLYGGWALSQKTDATREDFFPFTVPLPPSVKTTKQFQYDTSGTFGVRGGYWLESLPWLGGAMDLSFFQRKAEGAHIDLVPLSLLLMLRYPLITNNEFPKGKLQPYIGIGPSFFYSHSTMDFGPPLGQATHGNFFTDVGLDVRAGTSWQFHRAVAVFFEYRFTHVKLGYKEEHCIGLSCLGNDPVTVTEHTIGTTINTHHFLMGIRF